MGHLSSVGGSWPRLANGKKRKKVLLSPRGGTTTALSLGIPRERAGSFCGRIGWPKLGSRLRYFFGAGFVLSCFGFMPFLSFFCELLPLPMLCSLTFVPASRPPAGLPAHVIGIIAVGAQSHRRDLVGRPFNARR